MTLDILSNPPSWQRLLSDATIEQSVSEERVRELLSENSNYIRAIDYDSEYSGIYLLTKQMFPSKEGILISALNIEPIPLAHDTGTEIELLGSANGLFLYRLHYYWD